MQKNMQEFSQFKFSSANIFAKFIAKKTAENFAEKFTKIKYSLSSAPPWPGGYRARFLTSRLAVRSHWASTQMDQGVFFFFNFFFVGNGVTSVPTSETMSIFEIGSALIIVNFSVKFSAVFFKNKFCKNICRQKLA